MVLFKNYVSRWGFILSKCKGKSVLHLGCIGNTIGSTSEKVKGMVESSVLHAQLHEICEDLVGIDYDRIAVDELINRGFSEILYGEAQHLEEVELLKTFDIILCGDLIEHLSEPGKMLEGIKRFMHRDSELLITTPNSFGFLHFLRYSIRLFREGSDHVLSFSIFTLQNLICRYGFYLCEAYTCYDRPPVTYKERIQYSVGIPFFEFFPKFGGTLLVVAKLK